MPTLRPLSLAMLLAVLIGLSAGVEAARPMLTDDARLTDAQACQLESWARFNRGSHELWALPACNPGGNLEFTVGGAQADRAGQSPSGGLVVQGKTLFKALDSNGYGVGLAAGYATQPGHGQSGDPYFYIPASFSLADDRVVLHANLGATHLRESRQSRLTWAIGSELQSSERLYVVVESFGQDKGSPSYQAGLRYWLSPNRVQIDTTWGSNGADWRGERWFSLGLRLIGPPFLP